MAKIIELIYTEEKLVGNGNDDPYRRCVQLFTKRGDLVAEFDTLKPENNILNLNNID